jgi:hypothetical protein
VLKAVAMRLSALTLCCFLSVAVHARADDSKHAVDIPAGDLPAALDLLAKQSGADLVYRPEQLQGLRTQGAKGELSAHDAVMLLLKGTALEARTDSSGAMLIALPSASTPSSNPAPSGVAPHDGDESTKEGKKSSSEGFRVAQVDQGQLRAILP